MDIKEKLEALGLKHWQKENYDRIYINKEMLEKIFGVEIEYYKTGNIKNATINGEKISNNKATQMFTRKIFFDCKANKFNIDLNCIL